MKSKALLPIFLCLPLLASCGDEFAKNVSDSADFVTVADFSQVAVASSSTVVDFDSSNPSVSAHSASLYQDNAFRVSTSTYSYTGFALTTSGVTQYVILDATNSSRVVAFIYSNDDELIDYRAQASSALETDYNTVLATYETFKQYAGVSSNDEYSSISLTRAEAGDVLGYTLILKADTENGSTELEQYVTFEKVNGLYAITDYSYRETIVSGTTTLYNVYETQFTIAEELPTLSISMSSARYIVVAEDDIGSVSLPNGTPLTPRE